MDASWLNLLSQHARLLTLDTALPQALLVERFRAREALSEPFRFEVDCLSASAFLDTDALVGRPMTLRLAKADGDRRAWHGYVSEVDHLGSDGGMARYRLVLSSWLAFLDLRRNTLIFQNLDVCGIAERLFADYPQAAFRFDVSRPLRTRAICTQYRETDLTFIRRLLAEEGLSFYFAHQQDGDDSSDHQEGQAKHTLVIVDTQAQPPVSDPQLIRFHRVAATEATDSLTSFAERRQLTSNRVSMASWQAETVHSSAASAGDAPEGLPPLEIFDADRAGIAPDGASAVRQARLRLEALTLPAHLFSARGAVRHLAVGHAFTLTGHPTLSGQSFVPLVIAHEAANNLGGDIAHMLERTDLENGGYRQQLIVAPEDVPRVPARRPRPQAPAADTAQVVGVPGDTLTSTRDHQVRVQFHWQRGSAPLPGGLTDTASAAHPEGHAPGDDRSGTWVRVAEAVAGPNWGSAHVPRIGAEVLVEYLHADIDQPLIVGQLYNGTHTPPYAAGVEAGTNHIGTLSGAQTRSLDGSATHRWMLDDAPGQLQQHLGTDLTASALGLGYLIDRAGAERGAHRGQGLELTSRGWSVLRAPDGLLASASARPRSASTQMDAADAVGQLTAAMDTAKRLDGASRQAGAGAFEANTAQADFHRAIDPTHDGAYNGAVNGQSATKPSARARDGGDPVERFAVPALLMEGPDAIALTTPQTLAAFAGRHLHLSAQGDTDMAATTSAALATGSHASLNAHGGPLKAIAAHGPVSIEAHDDAMQILADASLGVTSTTTKIDVLAKQKIVLTAGQSSITLEGQNITIACPGTFTVKGAQHPFLGAQSDPAEPAPLPSKLAELSATNDKKPTLSRQACACAFPSYKQDNCTENRGCANYYETDAAGAAVLDGNGQEILLNYESGSGTYNLDYKSENTVLTATLKIKVLAKEWQKIGSDGKVLKGKDGKPVLIPYNHDIENLKGHAFVEAPAKSSNINSKQLKSHIESILNQHAFHLTQKKCQKGGTCKCRVPMKLKVDFVTTGHAHATVNLFSTCVRADSENWGVTQVVQSKRNPSKYKPIAIQNAPVHETGHLFAWPDEYFLAGGAVYKKYINSKKLVDVKMKELNDEWQRETGTNLMGAGMYQKKPDVPEYYFHKIRDWFNKKTGMQWDIV